MLGLGHGFERMSFVTGLTTTRASAGLTQAARTGLLIAITGRWFAAIAAVLRQLIFQRLHARFKHLEEGDQTVYQADDGLFASMIRCRYVIMAGQRIQGHTQIIPEVY